MIYIAWPAAGIAETVIDHPLYRVRDGTYIEQCNAWSNMSLHSTHTDIKVSGCAKGTEVPIL